MFVRRSFKINIIKNNRLFSVENIETNVVNINNINKINNNNNSNNNDNNDKKGRKVLKFGEKRDILVHRREINKQHEEKAKKMNLDFRIVSAR